MSQLILSMSDQEHSEATTVARRFIAYRLRSEFEVTRKLSTKFESHTVEAAVAQMYREHLIDDMQFAKSFTDSRMAGRPKSASASRQELKYKGISKEIADTVTADLSDYDSALSAGRKKARSLRKNTEHEFSRKLSSHLARRGFNYELSRKIVELLCREIYSLDKR